MGAGQKLKLFVLFLALIPILSCMRQSNYFEVTAEFLNVRTTHGMEGEIIGILAEGDIVEVMYEEGMWSQIYFVEKDQYGWVYSHYLVGVYE